MKGAGRRRDRTGVDGIAHIGYDTDAGPAYGRAKVLDVSSEGMQLELTAALPQGSSVTVRSDALQITARGTVRHCTRKGLKFRVGIEFSSPVKLREPATAPVT